MPVLTRMVPARAVYAYEGDSPLTQGLENALPPTLVLSPDKMRSNQWL